ncbi:MAG TPA: hypothetical protein V6D10_21630 [Trichocoleus sp.]|jgi:hypothetical protein
MSLNALLGSPSSRESSLQSRAIDNSKNNSLRNATNLGTYRPGRPFSFRVRSSVNPSDRINVYKYQLNPGVNGTSFFQITAKGKGVQVQNFSQLGKGSITRDAQVQVTPTSPFVVSNGRDFNFTTQPVTFYLRVSLVRAKADYRIVFSSVPATTA